MTWSYTVDFEWPVMAFGQTGGPIWVIGGTFTDAQSTGSSMALATDHGVKSVLYFGAENLTDTDETVQIDLTSDPTVTITTVSNDDDGKWFAIVRR